MNKALVLTETQNEWLSDGGKLQKLIQSKEMLEDSKQNISKALEYARNKGLFVVHVGLRFQPGYPELANGKSGLHKAIPEAGTFPKDEFGSQFYENFKPVSGEFVVSGRVGASGFAGSNLDIFLRNNKIEDLYLTGYATHVCVESTMREAHDKGYNPILLRDACSAFTAAQQNYVIEHVVHHFGKSISTEEFVTG